MSFIISMVLFSFVKMIEFLILLIIGVFMFADAIKSLRYILYDEGKFDRAVTPVDDPEGFYETFDVWFGEWWSAIMNSYYIALGAFDPGEVSLYSIFAWPIFLACTLFNIIVLSNLLIAIVCEIFNEVLAQKHENYYYRLCNQISHL